MKYFLSSFFLYLNIYAVVAAPTINVGTEQADYQVGDIVSVTISLSDSPKTHGGGVSLQFNPEVFQVESVNVDGVWSFAKKTGEINNQAGKVNDILFANYNGVEGELAVATVQMKVVGTGSSGISLAESAKNPFSDADGNGIAFVTNNSFSKSDQTLLEQATIEETVITPTAIAQTATTQAATAPATTTTTQAATTTTQATVGGAAFRSGGNNGQVYSKAGANKSVSEGGTVNGGTTEYANAADGKTYNRSVSPANATRHKTASNSVENTEQNTSQITEDYAYTDNSNMPNNASGLDANESDEAVLAVSDSYMKYLPVLGLVIFFLIAFKFLPNKRRTK